MTEFLSRQKMILAVKVLTLLILVAFVSSKSYEKFKVYNIIPESDAQVQCLVNLKNDFEFWTDYLAVGKVARVMVSPEKNEEFVNYVKDAGLNTTVSISDIQILIDAQKIPANIDRSASLGSLAWNKYNNLTEIHAWLDELVELYPGIVTVKNIGNSFEGRIIKAVVIDFKAGEREGTPLIGIIEGGIHATEWASPATVTWIIKEFLTSNDPDVRHMAESFIWHIIPVLNPDGYVYTFDGDRMWRKNRNPTNFAACATGISDDLGNGIDLNRNFDYLWSKVGASDQPCTTNYAGPVATSELETQALSTYILNLQKTGNLLYYIAFHSFSQMILLPYSHLSGMDVLQVSNYGDLYEIATRGAKRLEEIHGTPYTVGTAKEILYEVTGTSFDWVKGVLNVPLTFLFEVRDLGYYGFLLPSEQIIPNNEEIMACLVEMDKTARMLNYYHSGNAGVVASVVSVVMSVGFLILLRLTGI